MQRMARAPVRASTPEMGPAILASGYLTKRTRALGRWKKRWWQLSDDGTLIYFKSEERAKVLGEIDVARSCYDVKLGAERCGIDFPRVVPSCCCLSFSVLKRTYYLYASTAAEARRWAESLGNVSLVLNYKKKTQRPAPGPPRPASYMPGRGDTHTGVALRAATQVRRERPANNRYSLPSRQPGGREPSVREDDDLPTELPQLARGRQGRHTIAGASHRFGSVPDLQGQAHAYPHRYVRTSSNNRLWLDGSPQPVGARHGRDRRGAGLRSPSNSLSQPLSSSYGENLDTIHLREPWVMDSRGVAPHRQRQADREGYELPPRAQSVDVSTIQQKRARFSLQHQQVRIPVLPFLSQDSGQEFMTEAGLVRHKHPPPPVKPKPILKKPRRVQSRESGEVMTTRSFNVSSPTESESSVAVTTAQVRSDDQPPALPPKRPSMRVSVDCKSGQRDIFLPPPPDFKPPPPPDTRSESSSPASVSGSERGAEMETQSPSKSSIRRTSWVSGHSQSYSKGQDADSWAWEQLHQVSIA